MTFYAEVHKKVMGSLKNNFIPLKRDNQIRPKSERQFCELIFERALKRLKLKAVLRFSNNTQFLKKFNIISAVVTGFWMIENMDES